MFKRNQNPLNGLDRRSLTRKSRPWNLHTRAVYILMELVYFACTLINGYLNHLLIQFGVNVLYDFLDSLFFGDPTCNAALTTSNIIIYILIFIASILTNAVITAINIKMDKIKQCKSNQEKDTLIRKELADQETEV